MTAEKTTNILNMFVERARQLYSLPAVAMRVLELTNHPTIDIRELKQHIETDPALSAKVLRVVNSSLFGLRGKVGDLNQAVALLGVNSLRLVVIGLNLPPLMTQGVETETLQLYWRHAIIKAVAAREMCVVLWRVPGDEAFTAALLQDVGVLVLIKELGETYASFLKSFYKEGGDLAEAEVQTLGFDHGLLSARLLSHWGIPDSIVHAVGMPCDVERLTALSATQSVTPQVLHLAELLARVLMRSDPYALRALHVAGKRYRGLNNEQLRQIIDAVQNHEPSLAEALSLSVDPCNYRQNLAAAEAATADCATDPVHNLLNEMGELRSDILRSGTRPAAAETVPPTARPAATPPATPPATPLNVSSAAPADARSPIDAGDWVEPADYGSATATLAAPAENVFHQKPEAPGLFTRLEIALSRARTSRQPLTFMFIELDHLEHLAVEFGLEAVEACLQRLTELVSSAIRGSECLPHGENRLAVILRNTERDTAVKLARVLFRAVESWRAQSPLGDLATLSIGVASIAQAPPNFPGSEMVDAAERCLYGARNSAGNSIKSISVL